MNKNALIIGGIVAVGTGLLLFGRNSSAVSGGVTTVLKSGGDFEFPEIDLPELPNNIYNISGNPINAVTTPAVNLLFHSASGPNSMGDVILNLVGGRPNELNFISVNPVTEKEAACNVCSPPQSPGPQPMTESQLADKLANQVTIPRGWENASFMYETVIAEGKNNQIGYSRVSGSV